jgi:hypothetical protein
VKKLPNVLKSSQNSRQAKKGKKNCIEAQLESPKPLLKPSKIPKNQTSYLYLIWTKKLIQLLNSK